MVPDRDRMSPDRTDSILQGGPFVLTQLILTAGIVVIVSALCNMAEAALYAVPISHVEVLADSGTRSGRALKKLRGDIAMAITSILTFNTIANTMGAMAAGVAAAAVFGEKYLSLFSATLTVVSSCSARSCPRPLGWPTASRSPP